MAFSFGFRATHLGSSLLLAGLCAGMPASSASAAGSKIVAVGAENEYADVIAQIGGKYVSASAIMSNPNTDPHHFEASASIARTVKAARVIVQNGAGYDDFMAKIESASPSSQRKVLVAQKLLGRPNSTPNPHLWYRPATMPAVAKALVVELSAVQPSHKAYFQANLKRFQAKMKTWTDALARFKRQHPGTPVATTEPVADYMLDAAGVKNLTPFSFQANLMNDVDPAPQAVTLQRKLFSDHKVKALVYNRQVTSSLTESFLKDAAKAKVPVVGVYETMPLHHRYQQWMIAELKALETAVTTGK